MNNAPASPSAKKPTLEVFRAILAEQSDLLERYRSAGMPLVTVDAMNELDRLVLAALSAETHARTALLRLVAHLDSKEGVR